MAAVTALAYLRRPPLQPICWALIRDPAGKLAPPTFFSTDATLPPQEIVAIIVRRWRVEITRSGLTSASNHGASGRTEPWTSDTPVLMGLYRWGDWGLAHHRRGGCSQQDEGTWSVVTATSIEKEQP
jgi:hypothetical protein